MENSSNDIIEQIAEKEYEFGFITDIEMDIAPPGLNEDTIRYISKKKNEPEWMLEWRLKGYNAFLKEKLPTWQNFDMPSMDFQGISYYAAPKNKKKYDSLDEVDPELLATFAKLGIPLNEQKALAGVAVDAVFDSISVATTYKEKLKELGIIFCSFGEAVQEHPELVQKYVGSVVPHSDNIFAALGFLKVRPLPFRPPE